MPQHIQIKDCRFVAAAPTPEAAHLRAEQERATGVCIRIVIRRDEAGQKVWKLFETKRKGERAASAATTPTACSTCAELRAQLDATRARLAELERAPTPAKRARRREEPKPPLLDSDPRLPSNTKPHDETPYQGPALKGAAAARERKRRMQACGCRLCALCLNPAQTLAEGVLFGVETRGFAGVRADTGQDEREEQEKCGEAFDQGRTAAEQKEAKIQRNARESCAAFLQKHGLGGIGCLSELSDGKRTAWRASEDKPMAEGDSWTEVLAQLKARYAQGKAA